MKMMKWLVIVVAGIPAQGYARSFSLECVDNYNACGGKSLSSDNAECDDFQDIFIDAGHALKWDWREGNVWGNDFRDNSPTEEYSDETDIFYYSGHGTCTGAQGGTCDRPFTCTNNPIGGSNTVVVATESRWGIASPHAGKARWMLLDASCSVMVAPGGNNSAQVSKLATGWLPAFNGLHLVAGSHCSATGDILDSEDRGEDFAEDLTDGESYTSAWMDDGLIDVQDGACAVTMSGGSSFFVALNRMLLDALGFAFPDSGKAKFLAYSFVCE